MNVSELFFFSEWVRNNSQSITGKYQALYNALQHNATHAEKRPVEEVLNDLLSDLRQINVHELSNEQFLLLRKMKLDVLVGQDGGEFVSRTVEKAGFDPATAAQDIQSANGIVQNALTQANNISSALGEIGLPFEMPEVSDGQILVRVEFKEEASIGDIVDWKESSADWHEIVRGIAIAVSETPNDVRVVGATRGSIILELAATYAFVRVMAKISREIINIAKQYFEVQHAREDLRRKKILNDDLERSFNNRRNEIKKDGAKIVLRDTKNMLPDEIQGDQENALSSSIERMLNFYEKGGDIDFLAPEAEADVDDQERAEADKIIGEIRELVEELRSEKEAIKQLTDQSDADA